MSGYADDPSLNPRPGVVEMTRAAVAGPATFLILNALLGLVLLGLLSVPVVFQPEKMLDTLEDMLAQQPQSPEKQQAQDDVAEARRQLNDPDRRRAIVTQNAVILGIPAVLNAVALLGGLYMRRASGYPLAVTAAILSLVPLATGCCVTGLPFGIWALVVLARPEVKAGFLARRNAPPPNPDEQYMR